MVPARRAAAEIPFCDLRAAHTARANATEAALLRVARSGRYVLGLELEAFEHEFALVCGADHAVGVGSGTDAIALILRAAGIGAGEEVIVPAYTAAATWMGVALTGATAVGADIDAATGLVDPGAVRAAISPRTRAVIAVHLFGRLAPMAELRAATAPVGLMLIEDAAHAAGVDEGAGPAGSLGDAAAFSFYPTKTLGGLGDGGAVVTGDPALSEAIRRLRSYGWSSWQGNAILPGGNSRLDELQAAVLRERLGELPQAHARLRELAGVYRRHVDELAPAVAPLSVPPAGEPPWHQFVLVCEHRDALRAALLHQGIGTAMHYDPLPHQLTAFVSQRGQFSRALRLSGSTLSLPFDSWLSNGQVLTVCDGLTDAIGSVERSVT